jgi:DNA-binding response OmpR family regulator
MTICPCCGSEIVGDPLIVDLGSNIAAFKDKHARMSPHMAALLHSLNQAYPATVTFDKLISDVYGVLEPDRAKDNVRQIAHQCKRAIDAFGFRIEAVWTVGYKLVKPR